MEGESHDTLFKSEEYDKQSLCVPCVLINSLTKSHQFVGICCQLRDKHGVSRWCVLKKLSEISTCFSVPCAVRF